MQPDALKGLRDWLEEVSDVLDGQLGDASDRLKKALAEAADRIEDRLDEIDGRPGAARPDNDHGPSFDKGSTGADSSSSSSSSSYDSAVWVDGPVPKAASATSKTASTNTDAGSAKPATVGVTIRAQKGDAPNDVDFKLFTKALAGPSSVNDLSVSGKVQSTSGRPEKLDVKVDVRDWAKDAGDGDTLDFLLLIGGGGKGAGLPKITRAESKDVDLILNVNLKGLALKSTVEAEGLKAVKIVGKDGVAKTGYLGKADEDGSVVKVLLKPAAGGGPVGVLALDIQAGGHDGPSFPDFAF